MIQESILRYLGYLDYSLGHQPSLWNPVFWFREGVQAWLASPLSVLAWFGNLSGITVSRLTSHPAFKAVSGIAGLISFVSAIFTIALGWGDMHKLVSGWLGQ